MSWVSSFLGIDDKKNAQRASEKAYADQQAQWQKYGDVMAQMALQQQQSNAPIMNYLQGVYQTMLGMPGQAYAYGPNKPGVGNVPNQAVPWFLQTPGTSGADWESMKNALSYIGRQGLQGAAQSEANNLAKFNASRGVQMNTQQAGYLPGYQRWYQQAAGQESANRALQLDQLATQRRGEASNNMMQMGNYLRGGQMNPWSFGSDWAGQLGQKGANYGQQAAQYGSMFSQALGALGGGIGNWMAYRKNSNVPTTPPFNPGIGMGQSSYPGYGLGGYANNAFKVGNWPNY